MSAAWLRGVLYPWLKDEDNRAILIMLGAVVAAMSYAGWELFKYFRASPAKDGGSLSIGSARDVTISVDDGGCALYGVTAETINITTEREANEDRTKADSTLASTAEWRDKHIALSQQFGVAEGVVRMFLRSLDEQEVPPDKWPEALAAIAKRYRHLRERLRAFQPDDEELRANRDQAILLFESGDFAKSASLLAQCEAALLRAAQTAAATARQHRCRAADVRVARGDLSMMEVDYRLAAAHFLEAAKMLDDADTEARNFCLDRAAEALYLQGTEKGDNTALADAITLYGKLLEYRPRSGAPLEWARTQTNFGGALEALAERERGADRFVAALNAYNESLLVYTRDRYPTNWAAIKCNIGNALQKLGARENGLTRLEEATQVYHEALEVFTRDSMPLQWAVVQDGLGLALRILGQRSASAQRLEDAVSAHREALKERDRDRTPLEWATSQNNLGSALAMLAERNGNTALIVEAIAAFRSALQVRTRDRVPLLWAMTMCNLGAALQALGTHESAVLRLRESVGAFRGALQEYTRERTPLDWAATHNNLGNALVALGEQESALARFREAISTYQDALTVWTQECVPVDWALVQQNLGNAYYALGKRDVGNVELEQALQAYHEALKVRTRENGLFDWAITMYSVGNVLYALGERQGDVSRVRESISVFEEALVVFEEMSAEHHTVIVRASLASAIRTAMRMGEANGEAQERQ